MTAGGAAAFAAAISLAASASTSDVYRIESLKFYRDERTSTLVSRLSPVRRKMARTPYPIAPNAQLTANPVTNIAGSCWNHRASRFGLASKYGMPILRDISAASKIALVTVKKQAIIRKIVNLENLKLRMTPPREILTSIVSQYIATRHTSFEFSAALLISSSYPIFAVCR